MVSVNWVERAVVNNSVWAFAQKRFLLPFWSQSMALPEGAVVLEAGCGRGAGAVSLLELFKPARVDAFDVDEYMVGKARKYVAGEYDDRIRVWVGDITDINAADESYDAVFDSFILYQVKEWESGISEVARVLKPGGYFAFGELFRSALGRYPVRNILRMGEGGGFEREDLVRALAGAGLRLMEKRSSLSGNGMVAVARKP